MKQYKVIYEPNAKDIEKELNKLSKKGYEFVSSNVGAIGLLVIMVKRKEEFE